MSILPFEKHWINEWENESFESFKEKKLDGITVASALGIADAELLDYYDYKFDSKNNRIYPQLSPYNPSNSKKLETFVAEKSLVLIGERNSVVKNNQHYIDDFSNFRRKFVSTFRSFSPEYQIQILNKISKKLFNNTSLIGECYDIASLGSSVFAIELYVQLNDILKYDIFSRELFEKSENDLKALATEPMVMVDLWPHQREALDKWINAGGKGIVEMATATGKTVVGLAAADLLLKKNGELDVLVIAHSIAILNQWRKEAIKKLGLISDSNLNYNSSLVWNNKFRIRFDTIQTVFKCPEYYTTDLLIVDEVHHGAGKMYRQALEIPTKWKIGLSATVEGKEREKVLDKYLGKTVYRFTLKDAREKGIIPEFKLYIHQTFLDIHEDEEFNFISDKIKNLVSYINNTHMSYILFFSNNKFARFDSISDFIKIMEKIRYNGGLVPEEWNSLIGLIFQRRIIIHQSTPKIENAIKLAREKGVKKKCVMFCMDIETCEILYDSLRDYIDAFHIHSGMNSKDNARELDMFRKAKKGILIAPRMLDEGIDIPDAEIGINVSSSKTKLQLVQRMGRILRNNPGKKPEFHHFVALPRSSSFIDSEDSFNYLNDLAWIYDITTKMGISAQPYNKPNKEIRGLQVRSEKTIHEYFSKYSEITAADFGTIKVHNIINSIDNHSDAEHISPKQKLLKLLDSCSSPISDTRWIEMLKEAHNNEVTIDVPSHQWLLYISNRDPEMLKSLLLKGEF